ncbi:MAG: OmpA family protein [Bacteroidetes bacterium]|nr:OmpA family protein [Bacteroidota bacterium]
MNRKAWLVLLITIFWIAACSFWYACKIRAHCPANPIEFLSGIFKQDAISTQSDLPVSFIWNDAKPIVNDSFDSMLNGIFERMGPLDTLVIVGLQFPGEEGDDLGLERASAMWKYMNHFIDKERILTESAVEQMIEPDQTKPFDALRFRVVPRTDITEEQIIPEDQNASLYKITIWFREKTAYKIMTTNTEEAVNRLVDTLKSGKNYRIDVVGHTNNLGSEEENEAMARQRAWAIKKLLWDKGLDPVKIYTASKGATKMISETSPEKNERVEIFAIPLN